MFIQLGAGHFVQKHPGRDSIKSFTEIQKDYITGSLTFLIRSVYRTNKTEKLLDSENLQRYLQKYEVKVFYVFMACFLQQKPEVLCYGALNLMLLAQHQHSNNKRRSAGSVEAGIKDPG